MKISEPYRPRGCKIWYIRYQRHGRRIQESSKSTKKTVARSLLKRRLAEIQTDTWIDPVTRKATVDQLFAALIADYRNNGMAVLEGTEQRWEKRLKEHFGGRKAVSITTEYLNRYVTWCREELGLTNATINRDLAALRRAFRLAVEARQIPSAPKFPRLKEAAPRSGFVEQTEYNKLSAQATELWLRAMLAAAYTFGSRKSELLGLRVNQVDLIHRTIRLNPGETKNDEGRMAVMTDEVHTLIAACVAGKRGEDHVFTRNSNRRVKDFRERWDKLVADAGCGSLLFHDLRGSAVRNMVRSGIPEVVAMRISGHKTRSIFDRYNIVSERDLIEAARKPEMVQNWPKNAELHQSRAVEIVMENQVNYVN